jgi:hypothetical protein
LPRNEIPNSIIRITRRFLKDRALMDFDFIVAIDKMTAPASVARKDLRGRLNLIIKSSG